MRIGHRPSRLFHRDDTLFTHRPWPRFQTRTLDESLSPLPSRAGNRSPERTIAYLQRDTFSIRERRRDIGKGRTSSFPLELPNTFFRDGGTTGRGRENVRSKGGIFGGDERERERENEHDVFAVSTRHHHHDSLPSRNFSQLITVILDGRPTPSSITP